MSHVEDQPTLPKIEHSGDGSSSSVPSSPEPDEQTFIQENAQVQKRKGGRKPIYATSEERKQRNRQAQAAFRERRTEYIKQLETTIKHHEETLQSLQQSHRSAADECLMLRYKNSLLERILLEKGIDVQAELSSKTESPHLGPTKAVQPAGNQPSPVQRAIMNRHHQARRSLSGMGPKAVSGYVPPQPRQEGAFQSHSPQLQPTPPSHTSSPIATKSPGFIVQDGMNSPASDLQAQHQVHQPQQRPHPPPRTDSRPHARAYPGIAIPASDSATHLMTPSTAGETRNSGEPDKSRAQSAYYPSHFQNHINQLEQEYDAQADMLDDQDSDTPAGPGPGPYPQPFQQQPLPPGQQPPMGMQGQPPMQSPPTSQTGDPNGPVFGTMNQIFDPFDPMLDADPFGLTASMHFPTQFSFQESSMRQ